MPIESLSIPARDGYRLAATLFTPEHNPNRTVVVINSATAVPQRYYKWFASFLVEHGFTVVTYDYRGIGGSKPDSLRGFEALARDWALQDMAGVVDWVRDTLQPEWQVHVGHSYGGQTCGMLPNGSEISALVTMSSQSGHWRVQGGNERYSVAFHTHVTLPLLSRLYGYMPWSKLGSAEDLPKGVAIEWARWCRHRRYLLGDETLPLERYRQFDAPVLAYSFDDDDWGTRRSVDEMMSAYPNVTRRHVVPAEVGLKSIGHFGYFRPKSKALWQDVVDWLKQQTKVQNTFIRS